jgi:D-threo-aldose 1-dehydrogenase
MNLPQLGLGTAALAGLYSDVSAASARATVDAAWSTGIRYFDTAPLYDLGDGERRMGAALRARPRDAYVLSTKVGRLVTPRGIEHDYGGDGVVRSLEESLARLGLARIDVALIHDIDPSNHGAEQPRRFREAMEGAYPALDRLRRAGVLGAIGVGVNSWEVCQAAAEAAAFDCFLLAGRYTLLEQAALPLLSLCERRGIGVIVGAPYNTGILARGAVPGAHHGYAEPSPGIAARVRAIEAVCARHRVSLGAAALQFPLAHPAVAAVVPGPRSAAQVAASARWLGEAIPTDFWRELKALGLLEAAAPMP